MTQKVLEIENLSYSYRGNWLMTRREALRDISLHLDRGEAFGFIGHNGAGKTTTIKCILGLIMPTEGRIRVFEKSNQDRNVRRWLGYLPENPYFYDHLTVEEAVTFYAELSGIDSREVSSKVSRALVRAKIDGRAKSPMRSLSKGLTQRVALAQAIVAEPRLLVLDEPFSGLDPIGRKEFRDLFEELKSQGTALFVCSHILNDVEYLCDRVAVVGHGQLKGIYDIKSDKETFKGCYELTLLIGGKLEKTRHPERVEAELALHQALHAGHEVRSFEYTRPSLEEIFVKLVKHDEGK